jgi:hypothetical protein
VLLLLLLFDSAATADGSVDDSSFCRISGSLRNRKYTQSKCTPSSMAANNNASTMFNYGALLSEEEEEEEEED